MNDLFNRYKKDIIALLIFASVIKVLFTIAGLFLPDTSIEFAPMGQRNNYYSFNLSKSFAMVEDEPIEEAPTSSQASIAGLTLKAVYARSNGDGFVLLVDTSSQSFVIARGEKYGEYVLDRVLSKRAIFVKDGDKYVLEMPDDAIAVSTSPINSQTRVRTKRVRREEIEVYKKNPSRIWSSIRIEPHEEYGNISGFDVLWVKKGSVFSKLGLQAGDRIIRGNNTELRSISDAFMLYKDIDKIKTLKLTVLRGNTQKDLEYEIY